MTAGLDLLALLSAQLGEAARNIHQAAEEKKLIVYGK